MRKYYHSKGVREVWWPARSLKDIFDYTPPPTER